MNIEYFDMGQCLVESHRPKVGNLFMFKGGTEISFNKAALNNFNNDYKKNLLFELLVDNLGQIFALSAWLRICWVYLLQKNKTPTQKGVSWI